MGVYLNPGNGMFQESLDNAIYVDKSGLIACTNALIKTRSKYVCVSRPRRFGKTMALDMLAAYYGRGCDSRTQFEGLEIADAPTFEAHLNRYDVVKITMTNAFFEGGGTVEGFRRRVEPRIMRELAAAYPDAPVYEDDVLTDRLESTYAHTGVPFVFLIDEWDCVMREMEGDEEAQKAYLDWLRNLLKDRAYVALAYATGILPVRKYGLHSALNMFEEVSMLDARAHAPYTGFTAAEVGGLCARFGMDFDEARRWYDGYDVNGVETYNPRSVVMSMTGGVFGSYWTQTETYEALRRYIVLDMDGLRSKVAALVGGALVPVDTSTFNNTMGTFSSADDVLTLLVHLGYLTYDRAAGAVRVPNSEVAAEFASTLKTDEGWEAVTSAIAASDELLAATARGDAARVAGLVERAHEENASLLAYNDENSLACVLSIAYWSARRDYRIEREAPAGKGYADLVFWPRPGRSCPAFVVELKAGDPATKAVAQVRSRGYARALADHPGALVVGISYDPDSKAGAYKAHDCVIEPA